jgi:hypothetical protein
MQSWKKSTKVREADYIAVRPAATLCHGCKLIDLASAFWRRKSRISLNHHPGFNSIPSLQQSALRCQLCAMFLSAVKKQQHERMILHGAARAVHDFIWSEAKCMEAFVYNGYRLVCGLDFLQFGVAVSTSEGITVPLPHYLYPCR